MQETWVQSLIWENSLEEGMATHSSVLAWVTDAGSHPEESIRKCKFFKGLPLSPRCPSLDATHSSLWGKAPDCKGEQVASCFHFRLKSSDSPALKKQNVQPAGAL